MTTLKLFGRSDERLKQPDRGVGQVLKNFSVTHAVRLESSRSQTSPDCTIENLKADDVIELTFEDDIRRWMTVAEYEQEFGAISRSGQADELVVPQRLPVGGRTRGGTAWALKALRVFGFDPAAEAAGMVAETFDKKLIPDPGLYRLLAPQQLGEKVSADQLASLKPNLIFLHGTFSSTVGSFGDLPPEIWDDLRQTYHDRIFGLDHYTLSHSPIQNALDLVKNLPDGACLHLVSHSRGGLIGELLCRSGLKNGSEPFDALDLALDHPEPVRQALLELAAELKRKQLKIERFVRVACPAGGTTLASGRLDRWLELVVNVLGKVTGAEAYLAYGIVTDLLLEVKKQGVNPSHVPGLAAMVPKSPLVTMLNRADIEVEADLSVIAGDIQGAGVIGRLAVFFADLFYTGDHDYVVNTQAMYGGARRDAAIKALYSLDRGSQVSHFNYFKNKKTAERLQNALKLDHAALSANEFMAIAEVWREKAMEITARSYQKRSGIPQPTVFVLPGIMGSHLAFNGDRIWLDLPDLALGGMVNLSIHLKDGVEAQAPVAFAYAKLIDYLSATHQVIPYPFDWRHSIRDEARLLGDAVAEELEKNNQPVRILAHSMGGLVARAMFKLRPEVWTKFRDRAGCRLVMLGTPNGGSFATARALLGQERIIRMLALVDLRHSQQELLQIIAQFPGMLELLPADGGDWNFFDEASWERLARVDSEGWAKPTQVDLNRAREIQEILRQSPIDGERMAYVAGWAPNTPAALQIWGDAGQRKIRFLGTDEGDGRVPWASGRLDKVKTWYMEVAHGDLANHEPAFPALYELLETGQTTRLPDVAPRASRAAARFYELPADEPEVFPSQRDLQWAALAAAPGGFVPPPEVIPVKVSVAHGNLSFCECPVAVGHYEGDVLVSAEQYLDHHLDDRLSARHRLGLYPGREGTVEVVLNPDGKPGGAIIVGLGEAGSLSPQRLSHAFTMALLEFAVKSTESKALAEDPDLAGELSLKFATLLVGTGGDGLTVADSIGAILHGVLRANRALTQMEFRTRVRIAAVQFIELYKDRAVEAVKELKPFKGQPEFEIEPWLQTLGGGRHRIFYQEPSGWWRRLHVRAGRGNTLIFTASTGRARAEESQLAVQRSNIDHFVTQAVNNPSWDQHMAAAMYELMIPNRLKSFSRDSRDVVLVVDQESARYPWELIHDRRAGYDRPMVTEIGMIRQLTTSIFREQVKDVRNRNILVVGDPKNTPDDFAPLPGAEREARVVADTLNRHNFNVIEEICQDSGPIMTSLMSNDYRVLHLAGHGVYRYQRNDRQQQDQAQKKPVAETVPGSDEYDLITGMVLGEGVFLTAVEIGQMMQVPELVFINCCHLGVIGDSAEDREKYKQTESYPRHAFAASVARELINMGVKAVVAAGWAVDDAAALTFAESFYERMLDGLPFGEAVRRARAETYELHGNRTNTWGAYQCYGDPAYVLVRSGAPVTPDEEPRFVDLEEAIVEINNLSEDARTASMRGTLALRDKLGAFYADIERSQPSWLDDAALNEALGRAYGEVDLFERAVDCYMAAQRSDKAIASIRSVEQWANLQGRWSVRLHEQGQHQQAVDSIDDSISALKSLNKLFTETSERLSLLGSVYKRLAQISSGSKRDEALAEMFSYYDAAWRKAPKNPYPLINALVAQIIRYWLGGVAQRDSELKNKFDSALKLATQRKADRPNDFWAAVGLADAELAHHLLQEDLKKYQADLLKQYKDAWKHFGSPRELRSVIEHLEFIMMVLKSDDHAAAHDSKERMSMRSELGEALNSIWSELAPLVEQ